MQFVECIFYIYVHSTLKKAFLFIHIFRAGIHSSDTFSNKERRPLQKDISVCLSLLVNRLTENEMFVLIASFLLKMYVSDWALRHCGRSQKILDKTLYGVAVSSSCLHSPMETHILCSKSVKPNEFFYALAGPNFCLNLSQW